MDQWSRFASLRAFFRTSTIASTAATSIRGTRSSRNLSRTIFLSPATFAKIAETNPFPSHPSSRVSNGPMSSSSG